MILSIGLIVKNEEKYLRRCLEGIKPVLEELDAELIITDTGSTDRTVEIAGEFTDKIYYFEWCNDFSKARNANMDKASGQWYMYLDADEILKAPAPVIDFFKSGKSEKYTGMSVIIRSYYDEEYETYADYSPLRIFKNKYRFKNAVHEILENIDLSNMYNSDAVFDHYGYINDKSGRYRKKKLKYTKMTEELVEKTPENIRNRMQLALSYMSLGDIKNAEAAIAKAMDMCKNIPDCTDFYSAFYYYMMLVKHRQKDQTALLHIAGNYFKEIKECMSTLNVYALLINTYSDIAEFDKAVYYFEKYDKLYKRVQNGFRTRDELCVEKLLKEAPDYAGCACSAVKAYIEAGEYAKGKDLLRSLIKQPYAGGTVFSGILNMLVCIMNKEDESFFSEMYKHIKSDKRKYEKFNSYFLKQKALFFKNTAAYENIYKCLCRDTENIYYSVYLIRNAAYFGRGEVLPEMFREKNIFPDMLYIICKNNIPPEFIPEETSIISDMLKYAADNFYDAESAVYDYIMNCSENTLSVLGLIYEFSKKFTASDVCGVYAEKAKKYIQIYNDDNDCFIPQVRAGIL